MLDNVGGEVKKKMEIKDVEELIKKETGIEISLERVLNKIDFNSLTVDSRNYYFSTVENAINHDLFKAKVYESIIEELDVTFQEKLTEMKKLEFVSRFYQSTANAWNANHFGKLDEITDFNTKRHELSGQLSRLDLVIERIKEKLRV